MRFNNLFDEAKKRAIDTLAQAIASAQGYIHAQEEKIKNLLITGAHPSQVGTEYRGLHTGSHSLDLMKEDFQHFAKVSYEDYLQRKDTGEPSSEDMRKEQQEFEQHIREAFEQMLGPGVKVIFPH